MASACHSAVHSYLTHAPEVLALLPLPLPHLPSDPPYPEVTLDEVVTAIKRLKNNKSPGVFNILPEMLKYGGDSVHSALYRVILGIWRTEQAPQDFKQDILLPFLRRAMLLCAATIAPLPCRA